MSHLGKPDISRLVSFISETEKLKKRDYAIGPEYELLVNAFLVKLIVRLLSRWPNRKPFSGQKKNCSVQRNILNKVISSSAFYSWRSHLVTSTQC